MRPTLLLIHGFPLDHRLWDPNVGPLSTVTDVMVPDLRGFGSAGTTDELTTMETYAQDLIDLMDGRDVEQVIPCGLSMGGYVAMALAEMIPSRVAGLILCNTRSTADNAEGRRGRVETAADARTKGLAVIARAMVPKVLGATTRDVRPQETVRIEAMIAGQSIRGTAAAALGMAERPDRTDILRAFDGPALVITGEEDELMPLPTSEAMADALPKGELVVIDKAGHLSNTEQPEAFNQAVIHFIRTNFP